MQRKSYGHMEVLRKQRLAKENVPVCLMYPHTSAACLYTDGKLKLHIIQLDLADLSSVREFATQVQTYLHGRKLDVLVVHRLLITTLLLLMLPLGPQQHIVHLSCSRLMMADSDLLQAESYDPLLMQLALCRSTKQACWQAHIAHRSRGMS